MTSALLLLLQLQGLFSASRGQHLQFTSHFMYCWCTVRINMKGLGESDEISYSSLLHPHPLYLSLDFSGVGHAAGVDSAAWGRQSSAKCEGLLLLHLEEWLEPAAGERVCGAADFKGFSLQPALEKHFVSAAVHQSRFHGGFSNLAESKSALITVTTRERGTKIKMEYLL